MRINSIGSLLDGHDFREGTACRELSSGFLKFIPMVIVGGDARYRVLPPRHDGQNTLRIYRNACQSLSAKIYFFPKCRTYDLTKPSRPQEGRLAIATIRWCGLRWTRWAARRAARRVRSSRVVLIPRRWDQALSICDFGLAAETRRSIMRRGLTSPVPRGERGVSRKAIAQGVPE